MTDLAIKIDNLSKQYRLGEVGTGTLGDDINRWWYKLRGKDDPYLKIGAINDRTSSDDSDYVWALRNISFDVRHGEVLGILGSNGAGKSTLLKILTRITGPTTGVVYANGRVGALLEVGTGFSPEMTGRENIYMNGTIIGMTREEINRKLSDIVEFAGVERYLDTPAKRYSSGMMVRLGFSIAAHLKPKILIIDEVLAVGDAEFQSKAISKIKEISQSGERTVLFVSHNMNSIQRLCTRAIHIDRGMLVNDGEVGEIVQSYLKCSRSAVPKNSKNIFPSEGQSARFTSIELLNAHGESTNYFRYGEYIMVRIKIYSSLNIDTLEPSVGINNIQEVRICTSKSSDLDIYYKIGRDEEITIDITFDNLKLVPGDYSVFLGLRAGGKGFLDKKKNGIYFQVSKEPFNTDEIFNEAWGLIHTYPKWENNTK